MALPGVEITIGLRDEFTQGVRGVRNEMDRLGGDAKRLGGTLPQGFNDGTKAAQRTSTAIRQVGVDTKALTLSMVGLGTTMIGLATATSRLGQAENRLEKSKVAVLRIEDQIASTQKNLNRLIEQGKTNTEDYAVQLGRLETAYIDLETKQTDVKLNQDVLNDTYILFATTITNTAINSLFLMKSAFSGLTLAQIKNTLTLKTHTAAVGASSPVFGLYSKSAGVATGMTHAFGAALKTALPPLIAITAAFAAWEGLIAPYIKEQHGVNLSLIDYADSVFGAKSALESTNPVLDEYKKQLGETTGEQEELNEATRSFAKLSTPVQNAVEFQISSLKQMQKEVGITTKEWLVLQHAMGQVVQSAGIPSGFQSGGRTAPSSGGIASLSPQAVLAGSGGGIAISGGSAGTSSIGGVPSISTGGGTFSAPLTTISASNSEIQRELDQAKKAVAIANFYGIKFDPSKTLAENSRDIIAMRPHLEQKLRTSILSNTEETRALDLGLGLGTSTKVEEIAQEVVDENLRTLGLSVRDGKVFYTSKDLLAGGTRKVPDSFIGKMAFRMNPANFGTTTEIFAKSTDLFGSTMFGREVYVDPFTKEIKQVPKGAIQQFNPFFPQAQSLAEVRAEIAKLPEGASMVFSNYAKALVRGDTKTAEKIRDSIFRSILRIDPNTGLPFPEDKSDPLGVIKDNLKFIQEATGFSERGIAQGRVEVFDEKLKKGRSFLKDAAQFRKLQLQASTLKGSRDFGRKRQEAFEKGIKLIREVAAESKRLAMNEFDFGIGFGGIGGQAIQTFRASGITNFGQDSFTFSALGLAQEAQFREFGATVPLRRIGVDFRQFVDPIGTPAEQRIAGMQFLNEQRLKDNLNFFRTQFGKGGFTIAGVGGEFAREELTAFEAQFGGDVSAMLGSGLVSASGLRGFLSPAKRSRNVLTMARLRQEKAERNAFLNSEEYLIEQQISAAVFGARPNFIMSRSQADIAKRGGGASQGRLISAILTNILTSGAVGNKLGLTELGLDPRLLKSTSIAMSAFNQASPKSIQEVVAAAGVFAGIGPDMKNFAASMGRVFTGFNTTRGSRIAELMIRATENRPIWFRDVPDFVEKSGVRLDRMMEALGTLKTNMHTEFFNDNIDTRNEVLRLESRAYFIEREEAVSTA